METRLAVSACAGLVSALLTLGVGSGAYADVVTDGTVGMPGFLGNPQTLTAPAITIPQEFGSTVGTNLFHSFSTFNINVGQSVTFTATDSFNNVTSRVTGPDASTINGLLKSEVTGADFWFINPNGIAFGVGASLDVPASFHASTADYLTLGDCTASPAICGSFSATNPPGSTLVTADPSAFGFLDGSVGPIRSEGNLIVASGEALSFIGRLGSAQPGDDDAGLSGSSISAPAGKVNIVSVASAGDVGISVDSARAPDVSGFALLGPVTLDNTVVDAGVGSLRIPGGAIYIRGGNIRMIGSTSVTSSTSGVGDAGRVDIVGDRIEIYTGDGISPGIFANSSAVGSDAGSAGIISLRGDTIDMNFFGRVEATTIDGAGGEINFYTDTLFMGEFTSVFASTGGSGNGGTIKVTGDGEMDDVGLGVFLGGRLETSTSGTGDGGTLTIEPGSPGERVEVGFGGPIGIAGGGFFRVGSFSTADKTVLNGSTPGRGGTVTITADELSVNRVGLGSSTVDGDGGALNLNVNELRVTEGGSLTVATSGSGNAGTLTVQGKVPNTPAALVEVGVGDEPGSWLISQVISGSTGGGNAGNVSITADRITVANGGQITARRTTSHWWWR